MAPAAHRRLNFRRGHNLQATQDAFENILLQTFSTEVQTAMRVSAQWHRLPLPQQVWPPAAWPAPPEAASSIPCLQDELLPRQRDISQGLHEIQRQAQEAVTDSSEWRRVLRAPTRVAWRRRRRGLARAHLVHRLR